MLEIMMLFACLGGLQLTRRIGPPGDLWKYNGVFMVDGVFIELSKETDFLV